MSEHTPPNDDATSSTDAPSSAFPITGGGYEPAEVDHYVNRVNQRVDDLQRQLEMAHSDDVAGTSRALFSDGITRAIDAAFEAVRDATTEMESLRSEAEKDAEEIRTRAKAVAESVIASAGTDERRQGELDEQAARLSAGWRDLDASRRTMKAEHQLLEDARERFERDRHEVLELLKRERDAYLAKFEASRDALVEELENEHQTAVTAARDVLRLAEEAADELRAAAVADAERLARDLETERLAAQELIDQQREVSIASAEQEASTLIADATRRADDMIRSATARGAALEAEAQQRISKMQASAQKEFTSIEQRQTDRANNVKRDRDVVIARKKELEVVAERLETSKSSLEAMRVKLEEERAGLAKERDRLKRAFAQLSSMRDRLRAQAGHGPTPRRTLSPATPSPMTSGAEDSNQPVVTESAGGEERLSSFSERLDAAHKSRADARAVLDQPLTKAARDRWPAPAQSDGAGFAPAGDLPLPTAPSIGGEVDREPTGAEIVIPGSGFAEAVRGPVSDVAEQDAFEEFFSDEVEHDPSRDWILNADFS